MSRCKHVLKCGFSQSFWSCNVFLVSQFSHKITHNTREETLVGGCICSLDTFGDYNDSASHIQGPKCHFYAKENCSHCDYVEQNLQCCSCCGVLVVMRKCCVVSIWWKSLAFAGWCGWGYYCRNTNIGLIPT